MSKEERKAKRDERIAAAKADYHEARAEQKNLGAELASADWRGPGLVLLVASVVILSVALLLTGGEDPAPDPQRDPEAVVCAELWTLLDRIEAGEVPDTELPDELAELSRVADREEVLIEEARSLEVAVVLGDPAEVEEAAATFGAECADY